MAGGAANYEEIDQAYINAGISPTGSAGAPVATLSDLTADTQNYSAPVSSGAFTDSNAGDSVNVQWSATVSAGGSPATDASAIAQGIVAGLPATPSGVSIVYSTPGPPAAYTAEVVIMLQSGVDTSTIGVGLTQAVEAVGGVISAWMIDDSATNASNFSGTLLAASDSPGNPGGSIGLLSTIWAWVEGIVQSVADFISNLIGVAYNTASDFVWAVIIGIFAVAVIALVLAAYHPDAVKKVAEVAGGTAVAGGALGA